MILIPRLLFVLALVVVPVLVYTTSADLPSRVASHFGNGGAANGWMSRDGYVVLMLALTTLVPLFVVALTGFIPRIAASQIKIADRDHWLSPARQSETLAWLASHACWLGLVLMLFLGGIHVLTVQANARVPARLAEPHFFVLLGLFLALLVAWIAGLAVRFRRAL
ncbi:MAG: DUF1648 domain-containing protein [Burkholderiales bacterium]